MPTIHLNPAALIAAVVASFLFGWLWYGPLFGKKWAALMNMPADFKPEKKMMLRGMGLTLLGTFLTAYVIVYTGAIWRPTTWGLGPDSPSHVYGFLTGLFTWMGFYVPLLLGAIAWEGKSWTLFWLNAAYHFVNLQIIAMILAYWR